MKLLFLFLLTIPGALSTPITPNPLRVTSPPAPDTNETVDATAVSRRADAIFTIGYSLCSWTTIAVGAQPGGGSSESFHIWPGQIEFGCVEMDRAGGDSWSDIADNDNFFAAHVCDVRADFYKVGSNWDFYRHAGDGTKLVSEGL